MTAGRRPVTAFGDGGLVAEAGGLAGAHGLARACAAAAWPGVEEVVVGARTVTVVVDPDRADLDALGAELAGLAVAPAPDGPTRTVTLPVAFDGPDLAEVARWCGSDEPGLAGILAGSELTVAFVGFAPGFPYLVGLPPPLNRLPRRATPRPAVPAGSVAVGGGFAGVYPGPSPGGWHLLGRTPATLFDPAQPPYALLRAGDRVRLTPRAGLPAATRSPSRPPLRAGGGLEVEDPGPCTLVEDAGRVGHAAIGVPRAGPADGERHVMANRLVGNPDDAAGLELTGRGPRLRARRPVHVAVVGGAAVHVDGRPVRPGVVVPLAAGARLEVGAVTDGARAYLAVAGGVDLPPVLGSRASDVLAGIGPGPLRRGDVLALGRPGRPRAVGHRWAPLGGTTRLRAVAGPDRFPAEALGHLVAGRWRVGAESNRVGLRLEPEDPAGRLAPPATGVGSRGVVTGAVQVPPDGRPIVLGCDHATVGGYPVVATVVSADRALLGRLRPGDAVTFDLVDQAGAAWARRRHRRHLDDAVTGWFPLSPI